MKFRRAFAACILIGLVAAAREANAQESPSEEVSFEKLARELTPRLLAESRVPGAVVAVNRGGRIAWVQAFGVADTRTGSSIRADTVFSVGSISKSVAAWGVLRLAEEGKLRLDEPVQPRLHRWSFPPSRFDTQGITARQLLNHTSGLSLGGYPGWSDAKDVPSLEEALAGRNNTFEKLSIVSPPGMRMEYSGAGYTVAQLLVEEVAGESFESYMQSKIFEPLKMMNSSYRLPVPPSPKQAVAHDSAARPIPLRLFAQKAAAGLNTTAPDLAALLAALAPAPGVLQGAGVLSPDDVQQMIGLRGAAAIPGDTDDRMGLGYYVATLHDELTVVGHGGWNIGWYGRFRISPRTGDAIVVLTNGNNGTGVAGPLVCEWQRRLDSVASSPCKHSALAQLLVAYAQGGWKQAATRLRSLRNDVRFDLSAGTAGSLAHMSIYEAPLDSVTAAQIRGIISLLRLNAKLFARDAAAQRALAAAYLRAGQLQLAREVLSNARELDPKDPLTNWMLDQTRTGTH